MNDLHAVERLKQGDLKGLAVLVEKYQERAVRAAYGIIQDRPLAEDVVQTAFVQLSRTIHSFNPDYPFAPWFFKAVVRAAVKTARKSQKTVSLDAVSDTGETFEELLPDIAATPIHQIEHEEMKKRILDAMEKLTPEQRAVIVMRYYLDLETSEISEKLGSPPATIRWRLHSALKRLRGLLAQ